MEEQARVLTSLLARLESQEEATEEEGASLCIFGEFARLRNQSTKYRTDRTFSTRTAECQENIKKNRYKDIVPFDHSRVKLTFVTSKNDTDYINGNFIQGVTGSSAYIATQGPLPHTILDFLRMLWEYEVQVVVMACREFEMGKRKCERYWPQKTNEQFMCGPFTIHCESEENKGDYLTRTLRLTYNSSSQILKQLHYVNWPDHGVPDSIPPILDMIQEMRSYQPHDDVPVCIHCSAGCGRTGALCVIDYTWNLLKKQMITPDFNIYQLVHKMRTQRPSVVQTKEQYELVYKTIKVLFERYLASAEDQFSNNQKSDFPEISAPSFHGNEVKPLDPSTEDPGPPAIQNISEDVTAPGGRDDQIQTCTESEWELGEAHRSSPTRTRTGNAIPAPTEDRANHTLTSALCLMVEDPYFSEPNSQADLTCPTVHTRQRPISAVPALFLSNSILEVNSTAAADSQASVDEDSPPPLPERTPESYQLASDAGNSCERLEVVIPPNAAAEAVRELMGGPPSPVPPLPQRTPESFELATDPVPVAAPAAHQSRLGISSEWSGASAADATSHRSMKPWLRSKSLKVKTTFSVSASGCFSASNSHLHELPAPRLAPQTHQETAVRPFPPPEPERQPQQIYQGIWVSGSKQEPLGLVSSAAPPPTAYGGSEQRNPLKVTADSSVNPELSVNKPSQNHEKGFTRTRTLKLFGQRPKVKPPPPPHQQQLPPTPPAAPSSLDGALLPAIKLGFGQRFRKPKGPRNYPRSWL